ncbi:patatin-like phospholipase family protein [Dongia sedimenti]|uniref:Patatin-like phospholipase family protein n=1 Tax=Dongia sedimenti TaxID=3064282 RepID=A0ABU0YGE9_9PROT|nr:patatin-like phospholipase family protein [Rhodospirillaceae bacterium R-7]
MTKIQLPAYETVALVLQGGGALGSYQAGVYQGLEEAGIMPNWFCGISIGALNAAILAGNAPEKRLERLTEFWDTICSSALFPDWAVDDRFAPSLGSGDIRSAASAFSAVRALFEGQRGFYKMRFPPPFVVAGGGPAGTSYYDTTPLKETLERLVDFDRINSREVRVSVGAVDVETGNFVYFDNANRVLKPEHFMASGALPPGFPAVEIEGRHYWDGGLLSNTPLIEVLQHLPRRDTLAFQVDLWSARGPLPKNIFDVAERQKDIQYSSRTRQATDVSLEIQKLRRTVRALLQKLPEGLDNDPDVVAAKEQSCSKVNNVIHLIYRDKAFEAYHKDYEFSRLTMREHWESGLDDIRRTLAYPEWLERPDNDSGVVTHDVHRLHVKT